MGLRDEQDHSLFDEQVVEKVRQLLPDTTISPFVGVSPSEEIVIVEQREGQPWEFNPGNVFVGKLEELQPLLGTRATVLKDGGTRYIFGTQQRPGQDPVEYRISFPPSGFASIPYPFIQTSRTGDQKIQLRPITISPRNR